MNQSLHMRAAALAMLAATALSCAAQDAPSPSTAPPGNPDAAPPGTSAPAAPAAGDSKGAAAETAFRVVDGYKVDHYTMTGFRTWRAAACDRCHGANQEGLVGPSLVESLKTLSKDDFVKTVRDGRQEKGMVSFANNKTVMTNIDALYRYLKGRSNGEITRARVEELSP